MQLPLEPTTNALPLFGRRLFRVLRWHLANGQHFVNLEPGLGRSAHLRQHGELLEVQVPFRFRRYMAIEAVLPEQGPNVTFVLHGELIERCRLVSDGNRTADDSSQRDITQGCDSVLRQNAWFHCVKIDNGTRQLQKIPTARIQND